MQISKKSLPQKVFQPFQIVITIESEAEQLALNAIVGVRSPSSIRLEALTEKSQKHINVSSSIINNITSGILSLLITQN